MVTKRRFSPTSVAEARIRLGKQVALRSGGLPTVELVPGSDPSSEIDRVTAAGRARQSGVQPGMCVVADHVLWAPAWTLAALVALAEAIERHEAWLLFLEPVADLGWRRKASALLAKRDRARFGCTFTTDVPQRLRDAGLVVTTTVRFDEGRRRTYAWGEARSFPGLSDQAAS